jgi:hypothetical protein
LSFHPRWHPDSGWNAPTEFHATNRDSRGPCGLWRPSGSWPGIQGCRSFFGRSRCPSGRRVHGRSLAFPVVFSARCGRDDHRATLMTHASPSKTHAGSRGPSPRLPLAPEGVRFRWGSGLLSWGSFKDRPSAGKKCCASTPGGTEAPPSARSYHPPDTFRPCRSTRLRRFTPLSTLRVYCTPQPAMGFAMFRAGLAAPSEKGAARSAVLDGANPSKLFPP